jgi:ferredoxin
VTQAHTIAAEVCVRCGQCIKACPAAAISVN